MSSPIFQRRSIGRNGGRNVRSKMQIPVSRETMQALESFCHTYNLRNENGSTRWNEAIRIICICALMGKSPPAVRAAKAVQIESKMLAHVIGPTIAREMDVDKNIGKSMDTSVRAVGDRIQFSIDKWMRDQLENPELVRLYRDQEGRIQDRRMIWDLFSAGMADPHLTTMARAYRMWMDPLRAAFFELQRAIREQVHSIIDSMGRIDRRLPAVMGMQPGG